MSPRSNSAEKTLRRGLLVAASFSIATFGWFLLGDSDGLGAAERLHGANAASFSEADFTTAAYEAADHKAANYAVSNLEDGDDIVARVNGVEIKMADVEASVAERLASLEIEKRDLLDAAVKAHVDQQLIDSEAAARGLDSATLIAREVDSKIHLVSDDQIAAAHNGAAGSESELTDADLTALRYKLRRAAFIAELRERAAVAIYGS